MLPEITSLSVGVVVPMPIFPFASILKKEEPDEDATLNIVFTLPGVPCTLNVIFEDVALIPATAPLSILNPVESVVGLDQTAVLPVVPPATDAVIPRVDVGTHCVEVPVERRICPTVPDALYPSKKAPARFNESVTDKIEVVAFVIKALVVNVFANDAPFAESCVVEAILAKRLVVDAEPNAASVAVAAVNVALPPVRFAMNALVIVAPDAERLVVDAVVIHAVVE